VKHFLGKPIVKQLKKRLYQMRDTHAPKNEKAPLTLVRKAFRVLCVSITKEADCLNSLHCDPAGIIFSAPQYLDFHPNIPI
jgi:hypothetical protein